MCYWVLNKQGNMISRSMVQHVTKEDLLNLILKETLELADKNVKEKLADEKHELESCPENKFFHEDILLDEEEEREFDTEIPESGLDGLMGANVKLQHNVQTLKAKIMKQDIGPDGKPIGKYNQNYILDSKKYEVEIPDGVVDEHYHNILLENLLLQVDEKGIESILMKELSDHKIDKFSIRECNKGLIATKGWNLLVKWKYRTQD